MNLPINQIAHAAQHGSPTLLSAFGRLFGVGEGERNALFRGNGVPGWALLGIGLVGGVAVGIMVHRKWPNQTNKLIGGG